MKTLVFSSLMILFSSEFLVAQSIVPCQQTSAINQSIVKFVKSKEKHKVGRGECWDLAAAALDQADAKWDHGFLFGTLVNVAAGECVSTGDILQFEGVLLQYQKNKTIYEEQYEQHTAIVLKINKDGSLLIAQQNTSEHGKKVSFDAFDFKTIKKGKVSVYRPQSK
jgi:hypothetical protein